MQNHSSGTHPHVPRQANGANKCASRGAKLFTSFVGAKCFVGALESAPLRGIFKLTRIADDDRLAEVGSVHAYIDGLRTGSLKVNEPLVIDAVRDVQDVGLGAEADLPSILSHQTVESGLVPAGSRPG